MYVPKKNSLRDRIALYICVNGPVSMSDIAEAFKGDRYNTVTNTVHQLKFYKGVTLSGGLYSLTAELQSYYSGVPIPPKPEFTRAPAPFKPLSVDRLPWHSPLIAD